MFMLRCWRRGRGGGVGQTICFYCLWPRNHFTAYILKARIPTPTIPQKKWTFRKFVQKCHKTARKWPKMTPKPRESNLKFDFEVDCSNLYIDRSTVIKMWGGWARSKLTRRHKKHWRIAKKKRRLGLQWKAKFVYAQINTVNHSPNWILVCDRHGHNAQRHELAWVWTRFWG